MKEETVLTFYLGDTLFGIPIAAVKEVQRRAEYTVVPGAPPHCIGLLNLRGQVVTLFDMERMLTGRGQPVFTDRIACVVLKPRRSDPHYTGFLIDRAGDVLGIDPAQQEVPPANISGLDGRFLQSVVKLPGALLVVVRLEDVLDNV